MTKSPILTIAIPTFNRCVFLQQTIDVLLPQLSTDVELLVCDNCSVDGTWSYLQTLVGKVSCFRQEVNVGLDRNFLSCITEAHGQYVWLLCDDDLPCSNTVSSLLEAIGIENHPPMLYLRVSVSDSNVSSYTSDFVQTKWRTLDKNQFLTDISYWFTFGSSIVVRRDSVDLPFAKNRIGSALLPAAVVLATAGKHNRVLVSDEPLLFVRSDNTGGYNALKVFSKNVIELLHDCECYGYTKNVLYKTYDDNLTHVVALLIRRWPLRLSGLICLVQYSYRYPSFYKIILPAMMKRFAKMFLQMLIFCFHKLKHFFLH